MTVHAHVTYGSKTQKGQQDHSKETKHLSVRI
jgi:hypothetical protein